MAYRFFDADSSILTAASSVVAGDHRPIVQIGSVLLAIPTTVSGSPSISGAVTVIGNPSISGQVGASIIGTVPVVQSGTVITSIVSTVPSSVIVGASIFGLAPVNVTNTNLNVGGSVVGFQGGAWTASVVGNVGLTGTIITSLVSTIPSSVIVGASIFGLAPVNVTNTVTINPVSVSGTVGASVIGTVPMVQSGTQITSVIGAISPTGIVTSVATQASTLNLLASNSGRRGATLSNYSGTSVLVKLGLMSGVTDHTVVMQDTDYYEVPFNYSGVIQHFSSSVAGFIRITEVT